MRDEAPRQSRFVTLYPALVIALFVILGAIYSVKTPAFETPDEIWHFAFIHHVASGQGLPVSEPDTQALWQQQGVQAPGYYLAAAALTAWIDASDFPLIAARANPHRAIGRPDAIVNRNYLLPYADDGWPWRGTFLALHVARFFSVALGAVTLWASWRALQLIVSPQVAFFGVASFAFIPQFIFISAAASNDNAINALAALVLWRVVALVVSAREGMTRRQGDTGTRSLRRDFLILGALLGLAALTKLSALGLVGIAGLAILGQSVAQRDWRIVRDATVWIGAPLLLIGGWWYARNWLLYGDPLAWNIWQANILLRVEPAGWATILAEVGSLERSFWGLFGWMNVPYPDMVYSFFRSLTYMLLIGLAAVLVRWARVSRRVDQRAWAGGLLLLWIVVLAISWVRFMEIAPAAQGRYFFPAAPGLALLMGLGLAGWRLWTLPWLAVIVLFALSAWTPWWIIQPAYQPPPSLAIESPATAAEAEAAQNHALMSVSARVGDHFAVRGVYAEPAQLTPGDTAMVTVQWEALPASATNTEEDSRDYSVFVHLVDEEGLTIAQLDTVPGGGLLPTSQWTPGTIRTEQYDVYIPPTAYTPNRAVWAIGLYGGEPVPQVGPVGGGRLPVRLESDASGLVSTDGSALIFAPRGNPVTIAPPAGEAPNALHARFEDGLRLEGYTLSRRVLTPGDELEVTLYWRSEGAPSRDYTVFVHLLDEALDGVGGQDMPPTPPTHTWTPDQLYLHAHPITIPPDLPPGLYRLAVGMYARTPTGGFDRLLLLDGGGVGVQAEGADRYLLGPVRVAR